MKEIMTVYKALCELKTLKKRIEDKINDFQPVAAYNKTTQKISGKTIADYEASAKEQYQSITDLIRRRAAIKNAVIVSNGTTKVTINGKEMTVAEAIEYKTHGSYFITLLAGKLGTCLNRVSSDIKRSEELATSKVENFLTGMYGQKEVKTGSAEIDKARGDYILANTLAMSNPLNAEKQYETLMKNVYDFDNEFDSAISVSNATTMITIEY